MRAPRIGLMLYTVRDECARDLAGTLRRVAELGYEGVELWQLHGHEAGEVRGLLDEAGLAAVGRHTSLEALEEDLPALTGELHVLGIDRVALGYAEPSPDSLRRIEDAARAAAGHGLRLGFHNHGPELAPFGSGGSFLDALRELPPELLWLELDLGWVWHGRGNPVRELEKTAGRCPLVHVKDFRSREGVDDVPVGDGKVGYERVLPAAVAAGVQWLLVEEDHLDGPPFAAVERSLRAVQRIVGAG